MAEIPRAALDYLTQQINGISADAQEKVLRVLESIAWAPENIAECRDTVLMALSEVMPAYTDMAAQAGADFYDAVRETQVGEALGASAVSGYAQEATEGAVRAFVQQIVDGKPVEQFNRMVLDRVDRDVKRAENVSVAENAARDPLKPRYARVPTGAETCSFCLMLASRGFAYRSREAASHAHPGCDCRVVAGFDGMEVEGYDPDALYRQWKRIDSAESFESDLYRGHADRVVKESDGISTEYGKVWNSYRETGDFDSTVNAYLRSMQGSGSLSAEPGDKLWGKEVQLGSWLANCGHDVLFKRPSCSKGDRTADMYVDGELWEAKRVTSGSRKKLRRRVSEASEQSPLIIIDLSANDHFDMRSAKIALSDMLDDDSIERVMIVSGGRAEIMNK